jgi:hypothetical protein
MGKSKKTQLYRMRSIDCPELYVAQRAGGWARMAPVKEAMQESKAWWLANIQAGWDKHYVMEEVP